jgi:ABC-type arginine/histidine transport system permease subunit
MTEGLWIAILGTIVLWALSGTLACVLAVALTAGALSDRRALRLLSQGVINLTRGVPTSLFVIAAGITLLRLPTAGNLPAVFPGTPALFQHIAWGLALALALGSAGHLAEIFRAARSTIGHSRLSQATALGLSRPRRAALLTREAAAVALPPTGTRLVHHLHNSAFAALFPVLDLFGFIQGQANATFQVIEFASLGCVIYIALSGLIWVMFRSLEWLLQHRVVRQRRVRALVA